MGNSSCQTDLISSFDKITSLVVKDNLVDVTDFCKASDFALQDVLIKKLERHKMHLACIQQLRNGWLVGLKLNCKKENSYKAKAFVERPSWHPFLSHCSSGISVTWEEL